MSSYHLKNTLFKTSIKERKCEKCGIVKWLNYPAPLELHHIDGNHNNNAIENLQILCSNCHSLEPNFGGGNKKTIKKTVEEYKNAIETSYNIREACIKLGIAPKGGNYSTIKNIICKYGFSFIVPEPLQKIEEVKIKEVKIKEDRRKYKTREEAIKSTAKQNERVEWPSDEELEKMVWEISCVKIAEKLGGITDNAVRHRCQHRNIPTPPPGYWRKFVTGNLEECSKIKEQTYLKRR